MATSKTSTKPFNLGAATAAKLAVIGGGFTFELGDETFELPTVAKHSEQQLDELLLQTSWESLRTALGDDEYQRLEKAAKKADPAGLSYVMAKELVNHWLAAGGLGTAGE